MNTCFADLCSERKMNGIAEMIITAVENGDNVKTVRFPAMVDNDGEAKMIDVDDSYDMIIYHKLESINNSLVAKNGFGDSRGDLLEAANMSLMVYAFRDKIHRTSYWLEAAMKDSMLDRIPVTNKDGKVVQTSVIQAGNSSFDKLGLLQREYSEIELNYPNLIVFELKYSIQSTYKKGCLDACGC
jgi:hypothetical protein